MNIRRRLFAIVALALAVVLAGVAAVAYRAGGEVGDAIERGRANYLLGLIRTAAETNLSFGLPLDQMSTIEALMEREKLSDPSILAIDIFYPEGRAVYSTDRGALGEPVPVGWTAALAASGAWQIEGREELVLGTRIENEFGTASGGVAITLSAEPRRARDLDLLLDLLGLTIVILLAAVLIAGLFSTWTGRLLARPFAQARRVLADEASAASAGPFSLAHAAVQARARWRTGAERAERAMTELRAMDHD